MASRQVQFQYILGCLFNDRRGKQRKYVDAQLNDFVNDDTIDTNHNNPLLVAIRTDRIAVFRWLLRHPRTIVPPAPDFLFDVAIWWKKNHPGTLIYELALRPGTDLDYRGPRGFTALERAYFSDKYEVAVSLIAAGASPVLLVINSTQTPAENLAHQHQCSPTITRQRCQLKRRDPTISAACLFGLAISVDDYWRYRAIPKKIDNRPDESAHWKKIQRFFTTVQRLPTELQMLLCRRVYGLDGFNIPSTHLILPTALLLVASGEYTWE